jgi:Leucine-rich repeat (LRR) protein
MQHTTLASLPAAVLAQIHACVLQADPSLRSCLALEASCKELRNLLHSQARFKDVSVDARQLFSRQGGASCLRWIAAHGRRVDVLLIQNLELLHSTPPLCTLAGLLEARAVSVTAVRNGYSEINTLEPLRGLLNLAAADFTNVIRESGNGDVSLEPLAGLPTLERANLGEAIVVSKSLSALRSLAALTSLSISNAAAPQLDELSSMSNLRALGLYGFLDVTSLAPLSCLTALTRMVLVGFWNLEDVAPLLALSRLQQLSLYRSSNRYVNLQPICQLPSLTNLSMTGIICDGDDLYFRSRQPDYDLQPLSALSSTLQVLDLKHCLLHSMSTIGSLGAVLRSLTLQQCTELPEFQLAPMLTMLPHLTFLSVSGTTAADLVAIGQQIQCLQYLRVKHPSGSVTSLDALTSLTRLSFIDLKCCSNVSSIDPLTALAGLQQLHLRSCPRLASLSPLTALQYLRELRLEGCPQLAAAVPPGLLPVLVVSDQDA